MSLLREGLACVLILLRRHTRCRLEVAAKVGLGLEVEGIAGLLDGVAAAEHGLGLQDHMVGNPVGGMLAGGVEYDFGEILRRKARGLGIVRHVAAATRERNAATIFSCEDCSLAGAELSQFLIPTAIKPDITCM